MFRLFRWDLCSFRNVNNVEAISLGLIALSTEENEATSFWESSEGVTTFWQAWPPLRSDFTDHWEFLSVFDDGAASSKWKWTADESAGGRTGGRACQ